MRETVAILTLVALGAFAQTSCGGGGGSATDTSTDTGPDTADATDDVADGPDLGDDTAVEVECAADGDCDDVNPCTADSCDLDYGECAHDAVDGDGDGYSAMTVDGAGCGGSDCDDSSAGVFPGAPAVPCSTEDNDCNGSADEDNDDDGHVDAACGGGDDCRDDDATTILGECVGVGACCDGCEQVNGCWPDPATGLLWEDPSAGGEIDWEEAIAYCGSLSLAGHGAGEWRLPTIGELRTLVCGCPGSETGGACEVTDTCLDLSCVSGCGGCALGFGPGAGGCYWGPALEGVCEWLWSSSEHATDTSLAWSVHFENAVVNSDFKVNPLSTARCVTKVP